MQIFIFILIWATAAGGQCNIPPIPPIPPMGCRHMSEQCVCDANGQNCHYIAVCDDPK